jgi:hypothetical protein
MYNQFTIEDLNEVLDDMRSSKNKKERDAVSWIDFCETLSEVAKQEKGAYILKNPFGTMIVGPRTAKGLLHAMNDLTKKHIKKL